MLLRRTSQSMMVSSDVIVDGLVVGTNTFFTITIGPDDDMGSVMRKIEPYVKTKLFTMHFAPVGNSAWVTEVHENIVWLVKGDMATTKRLAKAESALNKFDDVMTRVTKYKESKLQMLVAPTHARVVKEKPTSWVGQAIVGALNLWTAFCAWTGFSPEGLSLAGIFLASVAWAAHIWYAERVDAGPCYAMIATVVRFFGLLLATSEKPKPTLTKVLLLPGVFVPIAVSVHYGPQAFTLAVPMLALLNAAADLAEKLLGT